jgi:hypothetical protein
MASYQLTIKLDRKIADFIEDAKYIPHVQILPHASVIKFEPGNKTWVEVADLKSGDMPDLDGASINGKPIIHRAPDSEPCFHLLFDAIAPGSKEVLMSIQTQFEGPGK